MVQVAVGSDRRAHAPQHETLDRGDDPVQQQRREGHDHHGRPHGLVAGTGDVGDDLVADALPGGERLREQRPGEGAGDRDAQGGEEGRQGGRQRDLAERREGAAACAGR